MNPTTITPSPDGGNEWTFDFAIAAAQTYSVVVTVEDTARNEGVTGVPDPADPGAITFEIDGTLPAPVSDPLQGAEIPPNGFLFISLNWSTTEENEYNGDTHTDVNLTMAILDSGDANERDLLAEGVASVRNGNEWSLGIANVGLGSHTLTFNGTDDAGNTLAEVDRVLNFTVTEHDPFVLDLVRGMNLISFPLDPEYSDINTIFEDIHQVDLVMTYERLLATQIESADVDQNGCVDQMDLAMVSRNINSGAEGRADVNGDGAVDVKDLSAVGRSFGQGVATLSPPPPIPPDSPSGFCGWFPAWFTAMRDLETGLFEGTLNSLDGLHAYWIRATAPGQLAVPIPPLGALELPPEIRVGRGWNLTPVISLRRIGNGPGEINQASTADSTAYFGDNWSRAFTFDGRNWIRIEPGDDLRFGAGYWVYFLSEDIIVP